MVAAAHSGQGPLLSYTRSMTERSSDWRMLGDYAIWTGSRPNCAMLRLHELIGNRVLPVPRGSTRAVLHAIARNRWFEVQGLFGYWLKADVDTVWLDAPAQDAHHYSLCIGGAEGRPNGLSAGWVCPQCGSLFGEETYVVTDGTFDQALQSFDANVIPFNSDADRRICPGCGYLHPESYGFFSANHDAIMQTARATQAETN
jgi:hypothetical protein